MRDEFSKLGFKDVTIQGAGTNTFLIRTRTLQGAPALGQATAGPTQGGEIDSVEAALRQRFGTLTRTDFSTVSSSVSSQIVQDATLAVVVAAIAILLYIAFAFRHLHKPFHFGACAVIALAHDAFVILGLFSILGKLFNTEVDTSFIVALLTVIGFSVHDTIVVFDRIRENIQADPFIPFEEAVNASLTETLTRSINTSFVVVLTVVSMLLIGGVTIRNFLIVLLVGVIERDVQQHRHREPADGGVGKRRLRQVLPAHHGPEGAGEGGCGRGRAGVRGLPAWPSAQIPSEPRT